MMNIELLIDRQMDGWIGRQIDMAVRRAGLPQHQKGNFKLLKGKFKLLKSEKTGALNVTKIKRFSDN